MKKGRLQSNDELLSKAIDFLRFPLIVGVIFIHSFSSTVTVGAEQIGGSGQLPVYTYVSYLFSNVISRVAVPLFFVISGFLFFYKIDNFTGTVYLSKLRKRMKTLLIPYIFWNLLLAFAYFGISYIPSLSGLLSSREHNYSDFETVFIYNPVNTFPLAYQFWFIRDLIVCVIISPLLYWIVAKTRHFGVILLGVGWLLGLEIPYLGERGFSTNALFFFSLGAWISCNRIDIIALRKELKWIAMAYPLLVVADMMTLGKPYNEYIHNLGIFIGVIATFLLTTYLIERKNVKAVPFLTSASFFVFAVHEPWLLIVLKKSLFLYSRPETDLALTIIYFTVVILTSGLALLLYYLLSRIMPSFVKVITGGR